jgi:hypothetical protein
MREVRYTFKLQTPRRSAHVERSVESHLESVLEEISFALAGRDFEMWLDKQVISPVAHASETVAGGA